MTRALHRYVFPVSPNYIASARYDPADGLFKEADGTLVPRVNGPIAILRAVNAREAEAQRRAEEALAAAERGIAA